ncbi:hypothetical protein [Halodesulfovibrio spirochaetisodalis]|uniref:Uncharacterized protein n=1 Tax=Halodesulfovibrio spirochaetisodalis TaxID=1560234 RepID=A0A1B7XBZ5_9BACT|nr:hypothetical protein [Halodesulfovibrio spirochaetisodalis]OBQ50206.1 hypothetical protein SP90_10610 [Halodesulfovibrio spirochaetisodalis]
MRVISKKVTPSTLEGFEQAGKSHDAVCLTKDGTLKAGKAWKEHIVCMLEPLGIGAKSCINAKREAVAGNRNAAWALWEGLVKEYGMDNAKEALASANSSIHGMNDIKAHYGIISRKRRGQEAPLTCHDIHSMILATRHVKFMRDRQMEDLQRRAPMPEHEAAFYDPEDHHTAELSDAIKNHQRVVDFVSNRDNLLFLIHELHEEPDRLNQSRIDYVTARLLKDVEHTKHKGVFSRNQIVRLAERALRESLEHKAAWSRMQTMKIGLNKRISEPSNFEKDSKALRIAVLADAKRIITQRYVQDTGAELGFTVGDSMAGRVVKAVLKEIEKQVVSRQVELKSEDFKKITTEELRQRVRF